MVNGSCLCGAVQFQVEEDKSRIFNCHCSYCRKSHGAAFATQLFAKGETLKFLKGEEVLSEYKHKLGYRAFCSLCGSRIMNYAKDKNQYLSIALGCVDGDFDGSPIANCFVGSKASWFEVSNKIPSFDKLPDKLDD